MQLTEKHLQYWNKSLKLTVTLAVVWFVVTFAMSYFARELSAINFFGWPLSFYMGAQGSLIVYVAIIWFYARKMRSLDLEYGVHVHEGDE